MHATPADFPFCRQPFSHAFSHITSFGEGLGDSPLARLRILGPIRYAASGVNAYHAIGTSAKLAQPLRDPARSSNLLDKALAFLVASHGRAPARLRPHRRDNGAGNKTFRLDFIGQPFDTVVIQINPDVR